MTTRPAPSSLTKPAKPPLLGRLSASQFMRLHWHKKPLLIRQALPNASALLSREELFALAASAAVRSRLVRHENDQCNDQWDLSEGPFKRLPARRQANWTVLVQSVETQHRAAYDLLQQFRFIPDARLDDVMVSYASAGGGVGPHFDSYDVFLLQLQGQRHWRWGQQSDLRLREGLPLKILRNFKPQAEAVLEPGDMLYLPPRYAHDGVALGPDCMTCSIGFRAPERGELARELLLRLADQPASDPAPTSLKANTREPRYRERYRDPQQPATRTPAAIPESLAQFAQASLTAALRQPQALAQALGQILSEPSANAWFETGSQWQPGRGVALNPASRLVYDRRYFYLNGEVYAAPSADTARATDTKLLRQLANQRQLSAVALKPSGASLRRWLREWSECGWIEVI